MTGIGPRWLAAALVAGLQCGAMVLSDPWNCAAFAQELAPAAVEPAASPLSTRLGAHLVSSQFAGVSPATATLPRSDLGLSVLRLRPVAQLSWRESLRLEAAWDGVAVLGGQGNAGGYAQALAIAPQNRLRWRDFSADAWSGQSFALQHNLDRLALRAQLGPVEIQLGRQAIGHGAARLLPAADLFGPFGPGAIATEFKRGVDALRVTWPVGQDLELEAIAVAHRPAEPGENADIGMVDGLYLLRAGLSRPGWFDASLLAGVTYRLPTLAFSISGDVLGAGWYAEGSARIADAVRSDLGGKSWHGRAMAGLDRQWGSRTRTAVEFSWQSHGASDAAGLLTAAVSLPRQVGEANLLGRWHAAALVSRQVGDLHSAQLAALANLSDGSVLLMPGAALSLADEMAMGFGALLPLGKRPLVQLGPWSLPRSEFGTAPLLAYVELRLAW